MDIAEILDQCQLLQHAVEETPFGPDTITMKVGGKIFAIIPLDTVRPQVTVKASPEHVLHLLESYADATQAPYMSKKHWVRLYTDGRIPRSVLMSCIQQSYQLVRDGLPKSISL